MGTTTANKRLRRLGKACCIALLALLLSRFVAYDITSLSYFAPLEKASDYIASDFYAQVAHGSNVKRYEERVAVVSSDKLERRQLSELFRHIAAGKPAVTAIDIMFDERGDDSDLMLLESIDALGKVVYPVAWSDGGIDNISDNSIYQYVDNATPGVVNLDAESVRSVIRTFTPRFRNADGDEVPSFATAAVAVYDKKLTTRLARRANDHEQIDFSDTEFDVLTPDDLSHDPTIVKDRIVMVGDIADFADIHATPVNEAMPGIMIHAHAAATILSGNYVTEVARWLQWLIAFLVCLPMIYAQLTLEDSKAGNMTVRWLQVALLLLLIIVGTALYLNFRLSLDLTLPLLMVALGLLAADIWSFAETIPGFYRTRLKPAFGKFTDFCKKKFHKIKNKKAEKQ